MQNFYGIYSSINMFIKTEASTKTIESKCRQCIFTSTFCSTGVIIPDSRFQSTFPFMMSQRTQACICIKIRYPFIYLFFILFYDQFLLTKAWCWAFTFLRSQSYSLSTQGCNNCTTTLQMVPIFVTEVAAILSKLGNSYSISSRRLFQFCGANKYAKSQPACKKKHN